jgi:hypothetical protein
MVGQAYLPLHNKVTPYVEAMTHPRHEAKRAGTGNRG